MSFRTVWATESISNKKQAGDRGEGNGAWGMWEMCGSVCIVSAYFAQSLKFNP